MSNPTLDETLQEFDAGIFVDKVTEALKQAALGTVQHGKKGSVSLVFELSQIGDSSSVQVKHTLKYVKPTKNGKVSEENAHVCQQRRLSDHQPGTPGRFVLCRQKQRNHL
jgi:hypothetical protein